MDKRINYNTSFMRDSIMSRVKFGDKGSVPIDQSLSQKFNIDPATGRPMSDVQRLVKMQNDFQMQAAFAQLHEFKSSSLPADVKDYDALKFMCPRLSQLPSELLAYREGLDKYQLEMADRKAAKKFAAEKALSDKKFIEDFRNELVASSKKSD